MSEIMEDNGMRTLLGTLAFVGAMVCYWICAYKCISCLKKKEERGVNRITVTSQDFGSNV